MNLLASHRSIRRSANRSNARVIAGRWDGKTDHAGNYAIALHEAFAIAESDFDNFDMRTALAEEEAIRDIEAVDDEPLSALDIELRQIADEMAIQGDALKRERKNAQARARRAAAKALKTPVIA